MEKSSADSVLDQIRKILADASGYSVKKIDSESALRSFRLDSLEFAELVIRLEDSFDVEIDDEELAKLITVKDAADYVIAHQGS